jgi:hypothetical protein
MQSYYQLSNTLEKYHHRERMVERGERREHKGGGKKQLDGYTQRLDKEATSFFFTNFPEDVKEVDLWGRFARFGRVGEVYIPKKLDKQGRRFGFVKYRNVGDAERFLSTISDIWFGTYKLRINRAKFSRDEDPKGKQTMEQQPTTLVEGSVIHQVQHGVSFKEVLVSNEKALQGTKEETQKVVWEVEVEEDKVRMLRGAYVGFLSEPMEAHVLQEHFIMYGYPTIKVTSLGHMKVLLSSSKEDEVEVKELVGSVG